MKHKSFTVSRFTNPSGRTSWRVKGWKDGKRIRENYLDRAVASARRIELEQTFLGGRVPAESLRPTSMTAEQVAVAEMAMARLTSAGDLILAVDHWLKGRKPGPVAPDLDDALKQFVAWVEETKSIRYGTKKNLRSQVRMAVSLLGNQPLGDVTPEAVREVIVKRWADLSTRGSVRRGLSRFFSWCMEIPRKWVTSNPAAGKVIKLESKCRGVPLILSLRQAARTLVVARDYRGGIYLKWVVLQLFCGLRPTEAERVRRINLEDGEIHLDACDTKTKTPRTVDLDPIAIAWLRICPAEAAPLVFKNKAWKGFKQAVGVDTWPQDLLRHTCLTHHVRRCGRYAETAEFAGNSERMIRKHYQGRSTKAQSAQFWTWHPKRAQRLLLRGKAEPSEATNIIKLAAAA